MSKFYDDIARGCLPTGEPLENLYGVGWWTEEDEPEPEPDPAELEAAQRWRVVANGELPKNNDYYWAHDDLGQQGMILFYDGEWNKFTNLSYITHWMPLPESPNDTQTQTFVYGKESNEE